MTAIFVTILIIVAALSADLIVETSAELVADTLLDVEAGAIVDIAPGPSTRIVNLAPQATIRWVHRGN
jgi:hypothetical protein